MRHRFHFHVGDTSNQGQPLDDVFWEAEVTAERAEQAVQLLRDLLQADRDPGSYLALPRTVGRTTGKVGVNYFETVLDPARLELGAIDAIDGEHVWLEELDGEVCVNIGSGENEEGPYETWRLEQDWYAHHEASA